MSNIAKAARERYAAKGPTGFLHPVHFWTVLVGCDCKYAGNNAREAMRTFQRWRAFSLSGQGVAAGKPVLLARDGGKIKQHKP